MNEYTPEGAISPSIISQIGSSVEEKTVPPRSNTGEPVTTCLIDALTFTFGDLATADDVCNLPAFRGLNWLPMEKGDLGYKRGWFANGICILYEGNPGMGTHVRMMGQACRQLEGRNEFQGWPEFLKSILRYQLPVMRPQPGQETGRESSLYYSAKVGRLDLAMDDDKGLLKMEVIEQAIRDCTLTSTYRKGRKIEDFDLHTPKSDGHTLYFGKRTGDSMIRFYDKAAKEGYSGHWVRCELELHDKQAAAVCEMIIQDDACIGVIAAGIVRRKLEFREGLRPDTKNGRTWAAWPVASWWDEFLSGVEKMRLGLAPVVRSLQKGKAWLMRQAAPLLATIHDLHEFGEGDAFNFLAGLIEEGRRRRPAWQQRLFECAT